ncbi:hypothetical protein QUA30_25060, partial [Microcoleus sp. Pol14C2]|uniref:hypothetical protein n=1 Tax=unclassified Microcoleus TaxID=2642155 RepID=UPI002FD48624
NSPQSCQAFCENIFDFVLNLYAPRVLAVYSRTCLRWLTPLLTMGSFFGQDGTFGGSIYRPWVEYLYV